MTEAASGVPRSARRGRRPAFAFLAAAAGAALALDAATKSWAAASLDDRAITLLGGRLLLTESRNPGAAFSVGTDRTVLITGIAFAVLIGIGLYARTVQRRPQAVAVGLVAGGAAGNLADRLLRDPGPFRGHVVDWIAFGWFPSFNLADTAITVGAGLLVLLSFRDDRHGSAAAPGP